MKTNMKNEEEPIKHTIEIEQKNGLFFVSIDGEQLTRTRKARAHRAEIVTPETFLTSETALKAAEKAIARRKRAEAHAGMRKLLTSNEPVE